MRQVSENVFLFRDSCNVYVIRNSDEAVIVDFGSGAVLDCLDEIGVKKVAGVLFTHYHRDQCQGAGILEKHGIPVIVPAAHKRHFCDSQSMWEETVVYRNYGFNWDFFRPARSIKTDRAIQPGVSFDCGGMLIETRANTGHTQEEGLTYIVGIDGQRMAFTGDLIHSPGKLWTYYDLQYIYFGYTHGSLEAIKTLKQLKFDPPDRLLPSHGEPMPFSAETIDRTIDIIDRVKDHLTMDKPGSLSPDDLMQKKISPHIIHRRTSFFIIADSGHALIHDLNFWGDEVDQLVEMLKREHGLKQIDAILLSHYHEDHCNGIHFLMEKYGAELWVHESFSDVMNNPMNYNIPCLGMGDYPDDYPIKVDRVLKDETFEWEGYTFEVFHMPGQTEYHQGLFTEMDGHRMLFLGDCTYRPKSDGKFRPTLFNGRNFCRLDEGTGWRLCADLFKKYRPDWAMSGHYGAIPINEKMIGEYEEWAKGLKPLFSEMIAREDPQFGTDPNWVSFYPYRILAEAGEGFETEVRVRNYLDRPVKASARLVMPAGWSADAPEKEIELAAKEFASIRFKITIGADALAPRNIITANIVFDGADCGELPEMMIDRRSEKRKWPVGKGVSKFAHEKIKPWMKSPSAI
jgi:glyoxylase-like metal-dependent hydrolase (beta-lactamase superfamily II)